MPDIKRTQFIITGQVQGVGFRPFIYRTALDHALTGSVRNTPEGVIIEAQGTLLAVDSFTNDLTAKLPPLASIVTQKIVEIDPIASETEFKILHSTAGKGHSVLISPDIATCPDCLADMHDPKNRRYCYPFTNCTNCGPRYTITRSIPYDRPATSMSCFPLCSQCQQEYENPLDRRFHAQPNACPACGPQVWLTDNKGAELARESEALKELARKLQDGKIAAVKGLGGFHLVCDSTNKEAVSQLRTRKNRPSKPLAVMVPDLDTARKLVLISSQEAKWLTGMFRPIVLCTKQAKNHLAPSIAPDTNFLGLMLPYTPLHHVLLNLFRSLPGVEMPALVMTSANMSSEPICLGNREAASRLGSICDLFCFHNRDILIRTDDSVLRVNPHTGEPIFMRRARGFTPSPVFLNGKGPTVIGLGPQLKCTLTLTKDDQAFTSQHIGDMENLATLDFHREITTHLTDILQVKPKLVVHDLHPDYMTTQLASETSLPTAALQHHFAHIHSALAENKHLGPAIGIALDGTGYGEDGTIWGGEVLFVNSKTLEHERLAHLATFALPGGEQAVRQPWRIGLALLRDIGVDGSNGPWPWLPEFESAAQMLLQMLEKKINCPMTSSCGRLFDAASALLGLKNTIAYEGQAAILLEKIQDQDETEAYPLPMSDITRDHAATLDTHALFKAMLDDLLATVPTPIIARRFHLGVVQGFADAAAHFAKAKGIRDVALSGGVMQNLTLAVELPKALSQHGLTPLVHTKMPPNDACISLGQAAWGRKKLS